MPLANVRYRVKTTPKGEKIRLAFSKTTQKVREAKKLRTGATQVMPPRRAARRNPGDRIKEALTKRRSRVEARDRRRYG